jgi:hypothetical protein
LELRLNLNNPMMLAAFYDVKMLGSGEVSRDGTYAPGVGKKPASTVVDAPTVGSGAIAWAPARGASRSARSRSRTT